VGERALAGGELAHFSVSNTGAIAYAVAAALDRSVLTWVDRDGRTLEQVGTPDAHQNPVLAPDGARVAYELWDWINGTSDLWVRDLRRHVDTRVTFDPDSEAWPVWSPDGKHLAYSAYTAGIYRLLARAWDGTGSVDTLYRSEIPVGPTCWSADGSSLFFTHFGSFNQGQLWVTTPARGATPTRVQQSSFNDRTAQLSPDGRWLAYTTNETGRSEVFVQAYPGPGGKWRVSTGGGGASRWRADGRELFYRTPDGVLMAVPVRAEGAGLDAGAPVALFQRPSPTALLLRNSYDVSADGQRFLVNVLMDDRARGGMINVVIDWVSETKR
jgi:Tol biopolymer transport system component